MTMKNLMSKDLKLSAKTSSQIQAAASNRNAISPKIRDTQWEQTASFLLKASCHLQDQDWQIQEMPITEETRQLAIELFKEVFLHSLNFKQNQDQQESTKMLM